MTATSNSLSIAGITTGRTGSRLLHYTALVAFGVALLTLSAKIQVPFWPVPMTLQTLAVMGIAAAYGARLGVATILAYLAAGLAGAPLFAGPVAGVAYFMGPTAGFLAGFVVIAAIVGSVADRGWANSAPKLFSTMVLADVICFAMGFVWLAYVFVSPASGNTLGAGVAYDVVSQYFLADFVKIAIAALAVPMLARMVTR